MAQAVDLSEFGDVSRPGHGKCWFARLTPEQQNKVTAAHEIGHTNRRIAQVVTSWGTVITDKPVGNHFNQGCACGR